MVDRNKVIKGLREIDMFIVARLGYKQAKNFLRTIDEAVVLLKGQKAVEPKHYESTRYNGELFACGDCKHELEKKPRFCPYCGKEVKWCD